MAEGEKLKKEKNSHGLYIEYIFRRSQSYRVGLLFSKGYSFLHFAIVVGGLNLYFALRIFKRFQLFELNLKFIVILVIATPIFMFCLFKI